MRKIASIILVAVFSVGYAAAQISANGVKITDLKLNKTGGDVTVTFTADVKNKAVRSDYTLTLTPVLANGANYTTLESIVVQGRRAAIQARREARSPRMRKVEPAVYIANGRSVNYQTTVPYESWMEGATLRLENTTAGCCTETTGTPTLLAQNLVIVPPAPVVETKPEPKPEPQPTTAERLALDHRFLAPIAELGDSFNIDPDRYIDEHRDGSLAVYFKQGAKIIDRTYRNNTGTLNELISVIRKIEDSDDSRIVRVVIAGFASPEGSSALNDRLAADRAATIKGYLVENTALTGNMVDIHNGGVDWAALRRLVSESNMGYKQQVLDIIDNVPARIDYRNNTSRTKQLMDLAGGKPFNYMMTNFFPELRNAAYIRVYYENTAK